MCDEKIVIHYGEDVDEVLASDESDPEERPCSAPFNLELDDDDDDDDDDDEVDNDEQVELSAANAGDTAQNPFSLRGGSLAFTNRSHTVFDSLNSVARPSLLPSNQESVVFKHKLFARPFPPPPNQRIQPQVNCPVPAKRRGVPDYLMHPERWTHYSLEDVTEMSDKDNSKAAHNFLSDLQQRTEQQEVHQEDPCKVQHQMIFFRPSSELKEQSADPLSDIRGKKMETRLSHLEEEDDEQECREKKNTQGKKTGQNVEKDTRGAKGEDGKEAKESFSLFKKTKHKNYRKRSGQEEN